MSNLLERLQGRGWRVTAQRRVIAEVLAGEHIHLTAEDVLVRARERLPELGLATVYNTLNDLVRLGEVAEVVPGHGPKRYDPNTDVDHHHLVCVDCGRILDVQSERRPALAATDEHGFELLGAEVLFRGRCPVCRAA